MIGHGLPRSEYGTGPDDDRNFFDELATPKQMNICRTDAKRVGADAEEDARAKFGVSVDSLTKGQACKLIKEYESKRGSRV